METWPSCRLHRAPSTGPGSTPHEAGQQAAHLTSWAQVLAGSSCRTSQNLQHIQLSAALQRGHMVSSFS